MNEKLLLYGFVIAIIPYVIIYILVIVTLKKEGSNYALLNTDFSNYNNLRKLVKEKKEYKWLYLAYLGTTFLPILIVVLFVVLFFT